MRAWEDNPLLRRALIALLVAVGCAVVVQASGAAAPACDPSVPQPPLLVVLPDGTEVPAASVSYDLGARRLAVTGYSGVFCSGFEGAP